MTKAITFILSFFLVSFSVFASDNLIVEGRLTDSAGLVPVESASVSFTLEIYSPGAEQCLLYQEQHTADMTGSNGFFSLELGQGSQSGVDYEDTNTLTNAFDNYTGLVNPTTCVGANYTPAVADKRYLRITYDDGGGAQTLSQDITIGGSAYAQNAEKLGGKTSADFLHINTSGLVLDQTNLEALFTAANYAELLALINGTSAQYNAGLPLANVDNNNQRIINVATPTAGTDATNKTYVDTSIGGQTVDSPTLSALNAGNTGEVLTWNGTQWTSGTPTATDSTKLPLAGGTLTGNLIMGGNSITNAFDVTLTNDLTVGNNVTITGGIGVSTGINSAGAIQVENQSEMRFGDADNSHYVGFKAPDPVTANSIWVLPPGDGASGQMLQTNGSGVLSWVSGGDFQSNGATPMTGNLDMNNYAVFGLAAGNSAAPALQFLSGSAGIYSPATNDVAFSTAGTERMLINASGFVGIANSAPATELDVTGTVTASFFVGDGSGLSNIPISNITVDAAPGTASTPGLTFNSDPDTGFYSSVANEIGFSTAGTQRMTLGNTNLNLTTDLFVAGVAHFSAGVGDTPFIEANSTPLELRSNDDVIISADKDSTGIDHDIIFRTELTDRMIIKDSGEIGIGTNTPNADFTIRASGANATAFEIMDNGGSHILRAMESNGNIGIGTATAAARLVVNGSGGNILDLKDIGTQRLRVTNLGDVGIGVGAPTEKLEVNGAIKLGYIGGGACTNGGAIQSDGTELLFCDGSNWIRYEKKPAQPQLINGLTKNVGNSKVIYTTDDCGGSTYNIDNLKPGVTYKVIFESITGGSCTFAVTDDLANPLTEVPALFTPGGAGAYTFEFLVLPNSKVYINMVNH